MSVDAVLPHALAGARVNISSLAFFAGASGITRGSGRANILPPLLSGCNFPCVLSLMPSTGPHKRKPGKPHQILRSGLLMFLCGRTHINAMCRLCTERYVLGPHYA